MANPNESLMEHVLRLAADKIRAKMELTPEQADVARWLSGNRAAMESLESILRARIEARGALPVPSTPTDAHLDRARDSDCRAIITLLRVIERAPLPGPFAIGSEKE